MTESGKELNIHGLIRELCILFGTAAQRWSDNDSAVHVMQLAVRRVKWISRRMETDKFVAAFVGMSNVGKSTLLNALFGDEIAPRKNMPWSSCPVEFVYGDELEGTAQFSGSFERRSVRCGTYSDLLKFVEQFATEDGQHAKSNISRLTAKLPLNVLDEGLIIADTPGFGAAQLNEKEGTHNRILTEYIPQSPQLFWIVRMEEGGISKIEKDFYERYLKENCGDLIVNYFDDITEKDRHRFIQRFEKELEIMMRFHFVNALEAFNAKTTSDRNRLDHSGIRTLEDRLFQLSSKTSRNSILLDDLFKLCRDVGCWVSENNSGEDFWPSLEMGALLYECGQVGSDKLTGIENALKRGV